MITVTPVIATLCMLGAVRIHVLLFTFGLVMRLKMIKYIQCVTKTKNIVKMQTEKKPDTCTYSDS